MVKDSSKKILAFQAPEHLQNYLALYTYQRGFTKSRILKQALSSWYLEASKLYPEENLRKQLIDDLQGIWNTKMAGHLEGNKENIFAEFKHKEACKMREKNIPEGVIYQLINALTI